MVSMESIKYNKKRKPLAVMLKKADEYIKKYDLGQSPEELFIEFEMIVRIRRSSNSITGPSPSTTNQRICNGPKECWKSVGYSWDGTC